MWPDGKAAAWWILGLWHEQSEQQESPGQIPQRNESSPILGHPWSVKKPWLWNIVKSDGETMACTARIQHSPGCDICLPRRWFGAGLTSKKTDAQEDEQPAAPGVAGGLPFFVFRFGVKRGQNDDDCHGKPGKTLKPNQSINLDIETEKDESCDMYWGLACNLWYDWFLNPKTDWAQCQICGFHCCDLFVWHGHFASLSCGSKPGSLSWGLEQIPPKHPTQGDEFAISISIPMCHVQIIKQIIKGTPPHTQQ